MRCVAFLRNVNQGQRGHPTTADIQDAFADAGVGDAALFQSNGTVVFAAADPDAVVAAAEAAIAARSGQPREVFWTPLATLVEVVDRWGDHPDLRRFEFTLHGGGALDPTDAAVIDEAERHRCDVVDAGEGWTLVRNRIMAEGHATPTVETLTGGRASSRGLPTVVRLVRRFADDAQR